SEQNGLAWVAGVHEGGHALLGSQAGDEGSRVVVRVFAPEADDFVLRVAVALVTRAVHGPRVADADLGAEAGTRPRSLALIGPRLARDGQHLRAGLAPFGVFPSPGEPSDANHRKTKAAHDSAGR